MTLEDLRACFATALRDEKKGKKPKGLLAIKPSVKEAEEYIVKAKKTQKVFIKQQTSYSRNLGGHMSLSYTDYKEEEDL